MAQTILKMKHITKEFPGVKALDDVNFDLMPGEVLGICGENGAGKSTLMKVLSGSYPSGTYSGEIEIDGNNVQFKSIHDAQSCGIEMIYQEVNMMLDLSIAENMFVGNIHGKSCFVDSRRLYSDTAELLKKAKLDLSPRMKVRPLNSGQMQMIALMRAYAKNPRILVLDEPTSALTDTETETLMELLKELRAEGKAIIYISHKLSELYRLCDRLLVMRDGKTISCRPIAEVEEQRLVEEMVGREVKDLYPKQHVKIGEEVLRVENLTVPHPTIKGTNIVENISFSLRKGEILGIGGLVGAGRSEILGAIFGQYSSNVKKNVYLKGTKINIRSPQDAIRYGIGFITEERKLSGIVAPMSIRENMTLASLSDLPGKIILNRKVEEERTNIQFERLRIKAPSLNAKLFSLSGGNQQKVILGKWLMKNPEILLIDEPTKGIDVGTKADFYNIMGELTANGISIVMVSSDMPELISMSDRCLVISGGRITAELIGDEITETNVMHAAMIE